MDEKEKNLLIKTSALGINGGDIKKALYAMLLKTV